MLARVAAHRRHRAALHLQLRPGALGPAEGGGALGVALPPRRAAGVLRARRPALALAVCGQGGTVRTKIRFQDFFMGPEKVDWAMK